MSDTNHVRLSVIVSPASPGSPALALRPGFNRRAMTERAIRSVLEQPDPIGTEVVLADPGSRDELLDYLKSAFPEALSEGKLQLILASQSRDPADLRNEAAACARGVFLAFLDAEDSWKPARLAHLEPLLSRHDLILCTDEARLESNDWIQTFLTSNLGVRSSAVVRRALFDEIQGFKKHRLPGVAEYEFHLRALIQLIRTEKKDRFILVPNQDVVIDAPQLPAQIRQIQSRVDLAREALTLLQISRAFPPRYWPSLARRIRDTGIAVFKKPRPGRGS